MNLKILQKYLESKNIKLKHSPETLCSEITMLDGNQIGVIARADGLLIIPNVTIPEYSQQSKSRVDEFLELLNKNCKPYVFDVYPDGSVYMENWFVTDQSNKDIEHLIMYACHIAMELHKIFDNLKYLDELKMEEI